MNWLFDDIEDDCVDTDDSFDPRPYQMEADESIWGCLQDTDRCGAYLATGTGKTEIAALLLRRDWGGGSLLITPRRELVTQSANRLRQRGIECGIEMAEMYSDEDITVACYASLMSKERYKKFLKAVKFIIVDESHMNFSTAALQMLEEFRSWGAKVCGMTASPPTKKKHRPNRTLRKPSVYL
jgi:superfamily II DNA or RNA helicase